MLLKLISISLHSVHAPQSSKKLPYADAVHAENCAFTILVYINIAL